MGKSKLQRVMVLGGEGQVGKPLCNYLESQGIKVVNVDLLLNETHDLRRDSATVSYLMRNTDFVFFLAYDVGGAKFLKSEQRKYEFLMNNTQIMANTFAMLKKYNKPFVFASSTMAEMTWSPYGDLKRLGEHFTQSLGGVVARFWNVYGPEHDEAKAHVITDFIHKAQDNGVIDMMTDGSEMRQFLYADDCSRVLLKLAENYEEASKYDKVDVTSFMWTDIRSIAEIVAKHYRAKIVYAEAKDTVQHNTCFTPSRKPLEDFWNPDKATSVADGIEKMIKYYQDIDKE